MSRSKTEVPPVSMTEVVFSETFINSIGRIRGHIVTADDVELMKLAQMCIRQHEAKVTGTVTDEIKVAYHGEGNELSVYFIPTARTVGKGDEAVKINKYAFLLALADDHIRLEIHDSKPPRYKRLVSISKSAARAMVFLRVVAQAIKEFTE